MQVKKVKNLKPKEPTLKISKKNTGVRQTFFSHESRKGTKFHKENLRETSFTS